MHDGLAVFAADGPFLRGNLHTHSTRSDGARSPQDVCAFYREAGYAFLCLSDHFLARYGFPITDTSGEARETFTPILGAEVHAGRNSQGEMWHILAVGLPPDFAPPAPDETGEALAARANAAGAFVGIAHPQWSSLTVADGHAMAPHAHAVELYNTSSADETGRGDGVGFWDLLINEGHTHLTGYATDDAHFKIADHGRAWVMVKAASREPGAIVAALKEGRYYSSTGPGILNVSRKRDAVQVTTSAVGFVAVVGRGSQSTKVNAGNYGGTLTNASLSLSPFRGDWCRIVVIDHAGKTAWTNPFVA